MGHLCNRQRGMNPFTNQTYGIRCQLRTIINRQGRSYPVNNRGEPWPDIASEGILSAELIKNAMFYAAEETNEKFESMPKTFTQIWTSFQNNAQKAFQPVLQRMNGIAGSGAFQGFVDGAIEALAVVAGV